MICTCFGRSFDFSALARGARATAELMVGVPDYDAYVAHVSATHTAMAPMSREEFFRERQAARYGAGRGGFRCC